MAEITLPVNATEADIAKALSDFGISSSRPATQSDIKGVIENKMIWSLGQHTNGKKNFKGLLREQKLQQIQEEYGFTADDVEVRPSPTLEGVLEYLIPESAAQKILDNAGGITHFYHHHKGTYSGSTEERAKMLYDLFVSGSLLPTAYRFNNGINIKGWSSTADIRANGGNYLFTYPSKSSSNGSNSGNPTYNFDALKLVRKLGFYSTSGDNYGHLSAENLDVAEQLGSGAQIMFKKNLSWADLATLNVSPEVRARLIELLTAGNNQTVGGVNLVEILSKTD
jgi:hypothetical protein